MGEFVLPFPAASQSASPSAAVLDFLQSTYEAGAITGQWDRDALEQREVTVGAA
jgi:hypothetical protein